MDCILEHLKLVIYMHLEIINKNYTKRKAKKDRVRHREYDKYQIRVRIHQRGHFPERSGRTGSHYRNRSCKRTDFEAGQNR